MKYAEKKVEMANKYRHAIYAIALANNVDIGVAQDMLESNILQGGSYPYVNAEEFKKDFYELITAEK